MTATDGLCDAQMVYNAINCGAACEDVPEALLKQLKVGGRMVLPLGRVGKPQWLSTVDKLSAGSDATGSGVKVERRMLVVFVPLTSAEEQICNPVQLMHPDVVNTVLERD